MGATGALIARNEGVRSLWKGLTPFAVHLHLKYALRFGTNAGFQSVLADKDGKLDTTRRVLAGFGAGVTEALVIVTPFEVGGPWLACMESMHAWRTPAFTPFSPPPTTIGDQDPLAESNGHGSGQPQVPRAHRRGCQDGEERGRAGPVERRHAYSDAEREQPSHHVCLQERRGPGLVGQARRGREAHEALAKHGLGVHRNLPRHGLDEPV